MQRDEGQQLGARERSQRARSLTVVGPAAGIQVKHEVSNNQPKSPNTHDVRQRRIIMNRAHIHSLTSSTGGLGLG